MRHRTLLTGILLLGSIFITSTVFSLPTFKFFVEDSTDPTPQSVGFVISVSTEATPIFIGLSTPGGGISQFPRHVLSFLPIPKVPQPQGAADYWKIGLRINSDEIPFKGSIFFTSADCSGEPWIREIQVNAEFGPAFDPYVVIGDSLNPDIRTLYAADHGTPLSAPMGFNSVIGIGEFAFSSDGCNQAVFADMQAKPAILLDADLHQTYPPPIANSNTRKGTK